MRRTFRLTFAGLVFAGITTFVFLAAINSQANLLFFAFGLMVGAMVISALFSTLMLGGVECAREIADHAEAGQALAYQYRLTNQNRFWPCFAVRVTEQAPKGTFTEMPQGHCLHLSPRTSRVAAARLVPAARGELKLQRISMACSFPFGLVRRIVRVDAPASVVVYPRIGLLEREIILRCREAAAHGTVSSQERGGNDEFYGLREYRAGDNFKAIHWHRTARTGQIMVREMTHALPPRMVVVVDVRAWREVEHGQARADAALELAAALICHGVAEQYAVGLWIAGEAGTLAEPQLGRDRRDRLLRAIAMLDLQAAAGREGPPRVKGAEWVLVGLRGTDVLGDIAPPGVAATRLAMDHPDARRWVRFEVYAR